MLNNMNATATIGVKNLGAAKKFYEGTLGLKPVESKEPADCVQMYKCGNTTLEVYESTFAGTNKATALTWFVGDDVFKEVDDLKRKGVKFEHYDNMPDTKLEGDVHLMGAIKAAWFKDPDGNILSIVNQ
jgi:catechol 2,3-dioxygenase-like lactoylglutathione lyase family enzyme